MKTILINPNTSSAKGINKATIEPPIGIAYLASYLKKKDHECVLIDANILQLGHHETLKRIDRDAKIIGISFNVVSAISAFKLVKYLKSELSDAIFIAGGPHPTCIPEICINEFGFDAVCIGEGEETFLEIVQNIKGNKPDPFEGVNGVYYKNNGKVMKNPTRKLIDNLDMIPFADLGLLPDLSLYRSRTRAKPCGIILASRGCPYQCTYCNKNIFHERYRLRSVENVISEIEYQIQRFGIKQIDFLDDNLTVNVNFANNLFNEIIRRGFNLFINLQNGVRADLINEDLVEKMKRAGVFKVSIGVESGDEQVQKTIKKNLKLDKVLEVTKMFKKYGIKVYGNFMVGLPGDNGESMQRTIDFAIKMNPDVANFMITIPLPGTELYDSVKKDGIIFEDLDRGVEHGFYGGKVYYKLDGMDPKEVLRFYKKAYRQFYFRPKKIFEIIKGIGSPHEFKWVLNAALEVSKSIFKLN